MRGEPVGYAAVSSFVYGRHGGTHCCCCEIRHLGVALWGFGVAVKNAVAVSMLYAGIPAYLSYAYK